jgi:hypothetical protein
MTGLKFGDLQHRSRSQEFFMVSCGVVVPLLVVLTCFEARIAEASFSYLPDVQEMILTPAFMSIFIIMVSICCILSLVGLLGAITKNKTVLTGYAKIQLVSTVICLVASFVFLLRWLNFAGASYIGVSTYYEKEWPNLMRFVHYEEF